MTIPAQSSTVNADSVRKAILASQAFFSHAQAAEGYWVAKLEADTSLTSEYLMLLHWLGQVDPLKEKKAVRYLLDLQMDDGGWNIFYGGQSNLSSTVKAYFALKLCGASRHEPFMTRARENILERGGVTNTNVFTKIGLALFGQYDWKGIPLMPPELILLPRWFYFNLYEVSYWSRTVIVPLLIIYNKKPLCLISRDKGIEELYLVPRDQVGSYFNRDPRWISWKNFFIAVDSGLKAYDRRPIRVLRERAIRKAHDWLVEHMRGEGGLGAIYPAMANSVIALRCLGYPQDHPLVMAALNSIRALEVEDDYRLYIQPCHSPVWDTALVVNALLDSGFSRSDPRLVKATRWLLSRQTRRWGDWQLRAPQAEPGGWYFQYENEFYPDNDDTSEVLMAIVKVLLPEEPRKRDAVRRGLKWLLAMQCRDGGWGAFDIDNNRVIFNQIPFADHGALLDPSTSDVTGRVLELLGLLGYDATFPPAARAIRFLQKEQEPEGCWYGRWGVNYIYGTWSVLNGLQAIGEDMRRPYVQRAVAWLKARQNPDGGWGESCDSYVDRSLMGRGESTASQTAWALIGLMRGGCVDDPVVMKGIEYLLRTQREDGTWAEPQFTGTGFPGVFYLRYHMYSQYFPLWALGLYHSYKTGVRTVSEEVRLVNRLHREHRI